MATNKLKDIRCKKCGFVLTVSTTHIELDDCYCPAYCEQNQENSLNPNKYYEDRDGR